MLRLRKRENSYVDDKQVLYIGQHLLKKKTLGQAIGSCLLGRYDLRRLVPLND